LTIKKLKSINSTRAHSIFRSRAYYKSRMQLSKNSICEV